MTTRIRRRIRVLTSFARCSILTFGLSALAAGCGSDSTSPATGVSGKWTGQLLQPKPSGNTQFDFSMNVTVNGTTVSGTAHINVLNMPQYYADFTISGTSTSSTLDFTETAITAQVPPGNTGGSWCLIHGTLTLAGDGKTMAGPWTSPTGCAPGTLSLTRS